MRDDGSPGAVRHAAGENYRGIDVRSAVHRKESHASAFPELGVNAADALTIAQTALGLLRQHIRSTDRIHGIVTNGGAAPNVVPAHTSARYIIRSETLDQLAELRPKCTGALRREGWRRARRYR